MIHLIRIAVGSVIIAIQGLLIAFVIYLSQFENIVELISYGIVGLLVLGAIYLAGFIFMAEMNGDI